MISVKGVSLRNYGKVTGITRNILPSILVTTRKLPRAIGSQLVRKEYDMRRIIVTMILKDENLEQLAEELAELLDFEEPEAIEFEDQPNRVYYGTLETEISKEDVLENMGRITLNFLCPDPHKYEPETVHRIEHDGTQTQGTVIIEGKDTPPHMFITLQESVTDLLITNADKELRIIYNLAAGDVVEVDCKTRKVFINGILQMTSVDLKRPNFFLLKKGANLLTFSALSNVEVKYRQRWL